MRGRRRMGWSCDIQSEVLTTHTGLRVVIVCRRRTVTFFGRACKRAGASRAKKGA